MAQEKAVPRDPKKLNLFDLRWIASLFGTAVGAGILFLPIRAGWAWGMGYCGDERNYFPFNLSRA